MSTILLAFLMLSLSFFFSGMEIAFLSANRLKIELKTAQGNRAARYLSQFKQKTSEVLITILIGNNLALVIFTMSMEKIASPQLNALGLNPETSFLSYTLIQSLLATLIVLVLAEYIPKAIFRRNADRIVFPSAYILRFFYLLLRIPVRFVNAVSKFLLRHIFRLATEDRIVELGKKDLDHYIRELMAAQDVAPLPDLDAEMLHAAMAFKETKARECMIPRTQMVAVPEDISMEELREKFISSTHSKILIYGEDLDDIKGFVHTSSMFRLPTSLGDEIQAVQVVPETMPANMLLAELTENQRSVAIVVDEFGGTSGMITMEDLVEEVFGEIEDEYDPEVVEEDMVYSKNEDGSYLLGARLEIDVLNEEGLDLPESESYTTLGGLVMYYAERIPKQGETILINRYRLTVMKAEETRIIRLRLKSVK